jgi:hypothetical protein
MKHLLSAIAVAALIGGVPAWAQTSSSGQAMQPGAQASPSDTTGAGAGMRMGKTHHRARAARNRRSPGDNMAEELNRQELERVQNGAPGASGSSLPSSGAPMGGQPNNAGGRAGSEAIGRPSPGTMEEHPGSSGNQ